MNPITAGNHAVEPVPNNAREAFLDFNTSDHINLDIESKHNHYQLTRLSDDEYYLLGENRLAIHIDYDHLINLSFDNHLIYKSFSKMYAALTRRFGSSGKFYDDWKGSFSFVFLIRFQKDGQEFGYLFNIFNMRSSIEFAFYKLISADDKRFGKMSLYKPFEEFTQDEINYIVNFICGYCTGYFNATEKYNKGYFLLITASNLLLSGHDGQVYFDYAYETPEEFQAALAILKPKCTPPQGD